MDRHLMEMKLNQKIKRNYDTFIDELKEHDINYIITSAKEIYDKSNILFVMNNMNFLTDEQISTLLSTDEPLDEIYTDYYDYNFDYLDDYRESIINTSDILRIFYDK